MACVQNKLYRCIPSAVIRATARAAPAELPPWPAPDSTCDVWRSWLATVWSDAGLAQAVANASPSLVQRIQTIVQANPNNVPRARRARLAALALARYALRAGHRCTPFGLFAGVAPLRFGDSTQVRFGSDHHAATRLTPTALEAVISRREADPSQMAGVLVCLNNLTRIHDGRVYVPSEGSSEYSIALTPVVEFVMGASASPITFDALLGELATTFSTGAKTDCATLLTKLLHVRLLRSALRAPATVVDPSSALMAMDLAEHQVQPAVAIDLRLDADIKLSSGVARELESAATLLTRLSPHPSGTPAWNRYAERFAERYGANQVPLCTLTDPARGLGYPDGFGSSAGPTEPLSNRDRLLLQLAATAGIEGQLSVELSAAKVEAIANAVGPSVRLAAPHLELCAQILAPSLRALDSGRFRIWVQSASRAAGTMTGRFWHIVPEAAVHMDTLPTVTPGARLVQLSFHPSRVAADLLTRAPQVLPSVISLGEYRERSAHVLFPEDLLVSMSEGRLCLASRVTGEALEVLAPTAINFASHHHTPLLARFIAEVWRSQSPQVTGFHWGAALALPFTPALRCGRITLVSARWRLRAEQLPKGSCSLTEWSEQLHAWCERYRIPERFLLAEADQQLLLDVNEPLHLDLLRTHLNRTGHAVLHEAPPCSGFGWIDGRAHSIVVPMGARE